MFMQTLNVKKKIQFIKTNTLKLLLLSLLGTPNTLPWYEWIRINIGVDSKVGVDANIITYYYWSIINGNGVQIVPSETNLIDEIWTNRPDIQLNSVKPLNITYTGTVKCESIFFFYQ